VVDLSSGFKEVVTAVLAFIIVVTIMFLLLISLYPAVNLDNAKGILAIFGGWVGIVVGYYFGRVPAERGTDKANEVADIARKQRDRAVEDRVNALSLLEQQRNQLLAMKMQVGAPVTGSIDQMINNINDAVSAMRKET
jgi:hypothetical protein